jgi:hypothetical protein
MKADQVNSPASTVVSHLEEIHNAKKPRLSRQLGSNVRKTDRLDGIYFDLAFFHPISAAAYPHMRTCPDAHTASDFSRDAIPQTLGKHHRLIARLVVVLRLRHIWQHARVAQPNMTGLVFEGLFG